jgi:hypothetical protein
MVQVTARLLLISALVLSIGCTTTKGSFCTAASPVRLSASTISAMTDAEVRDVLAHNHKGAALCGWKA